MRSDTNSSGRQIRASTSHSTGLVREGSPPHIAHPCSPYSHSNKKRRNSLLFGVIYALPNAQGYDEMKYAFLYHLNAYTYGDPKWFPNMPDELRALFQRVTKGALSGNAGEPAREEFKVNGEYVDTPQQGVVGIPFLDAYVEKAALDYLDRNAQSTQPFFMSVNFMKVHQPNLPHPDFVHKSLSKSKYADSIVEADARIGHVMDKIRALGLDKNTYVFWTTDNGAWQDVYP